MNHATQSFWNISTVLLCFLFAFFAYLSIFVQMVKMIICRNVWIFWCSPVLFLNYFNKVCKVTFICHLSLAFDFYSINCFVFLAIYSRIEFFEIQIIIRWTTFWASIGRIIYNYIWTFNFLIIRIFSFLNLFKCIGELFKSKELSPILSRISSRSFKIFSGFLFAFVTVIINSFRQNIFIVLSHCNWTWQFSLRVLNTWTFCF